MVAGREEILRNLAVVRRTLAERADGAGRDPADVLLVAATKTVPEEAIRTVVEAGVTAVGENYVNELRRKHAAVPGVAWHYIGNLQSNTARHVAALADVVETLAGGHATERLAERAVQGGRTLDALIEVDFTGARAGTPPGEVTALAVRLSRTQGLRLRGLMTITPLTEDPEDARPWFRRLRDLRERVRDVVPEMVDLSMGMSLDYGVAVEEGATMVRIGTALFGPRAP